MLAQSDCAGGTMSGDDFFITASGPAAEEPPPEKPKKAKRVPPEKSEERPRTSPVPKSLRGFKVRDQERDTLRKPLFGEFRGFKWEIEGHGPGLFSWAIGDLNGWTPRGSILRTALYQMLEAADLLEALRVRYGGRPIPPEACQQAYLFLRWQRMAVSGKIKLAMKRRKDTARSVYYTVEEIV